MEAGSRILDEASLREAYAIVSPHRPRRRRIGMKALARASLSTSLLLAGIALAGAYDVPEAVYPTLPKSAGSAELFVPAGWGIEVREEGDLNGDRRPDLLLVLRQEDPANVIINDPASPGYHEWDANPRILAVAFALKKGGYELALENVELIPRYDNPCLDDPFGFAEISGGMFRVGLHLWANAGTWYTSSTVLGFRYSGKAFRLSRYECDTYKRNTGESWDLVVDYASRRASLTLGGSSEEEEVEDRTYEKTLPRSPLAPIGELGCGWDYCPEQSDMSWWGIEEDSE
jgi:hypothetical protein